MEKRIFKKGKFQFLHAFRNCYQQISSLRNSIKELYPSEYHALSNGKPVQQSSKIISLNSIFKDLIKVGGQIHHADVPENAKHQVILAKEHPLSSLVIQNIHKENFHVGREHTLALLRQQYWIPACRGLIRTILHNCLRCKRDRVLPKPTFMGDLPKERLSIDNTPFNNTGVDYLDHIMLKSQK